MGCETHIGIEIFGRKDNFKNVESCHDSSDVMSEFLDK